MEKEYVITDSGKKLEIFEIQGEKVYFYRRRFRSVDGKKVSCSGCGKIKAHSKFYVRTLNKGNYDSKCKECRSNNDKSNAAKYPHLISKVTLNTKIKHILEQADKEAKVSFSFSDTMNAFETICRESTSASLKAKRDLRNKK